MYLPTQFEETRLDVMHALVACHPLGALVTNGSSGLDAQHIPFEISAPTAQAPLGVLRAHVARANAVWRDAGGEALVLFQGPSAYVSPEFYEQKLINGKVVPTWNYAVVHARGRLRAVDDKDWLLGLLDRLTHAHEAGRTRPWALADAPGEFIDGLLKAIVGIEIVIDRIEGKWKVSQNRTMRDQVRITSGLASEKGGAAMSEFMRQRLALQEQRAD